MWFDSSCSFKVATVYLSVVMIGRLDGLLITAEKFSTTVVDFGAARSAGISSLAKLF